MIPAAEFASTANQVQGLCPSKSVDTFRRKKLVHLAKLINSNDT
jgi:hypothetical protein